jgi:hypothetical protein
MRVADVPISLPVMAKIVAKERTFARNFCGTKSLVKREFRLMAQKLRLLQIWAEINL